MTPLEWPLWWTASSRSRSRTTTLGAGMAALELARRGDADDAAADDADVAARRGRRRSRRRTVLRASPPALVQSCAWESRAAGSLRSRGVSIALAVARRDPRPRRRLSPLRAPGALPARQPRRRTPGRRSTTSGPGSRSRSRSSTGSSTPAPASSSTRGRSSSRSSSRRSARRPPRRPSPRRSRRSTRSSPTATPNTLLLNLTDATVVAAKALDALAPQLGKSVPKEINDVKTAILDSQITITPLRFVHEVDLLRDRPADPRRPAARRLGRGRPGPAPRGPAGRDRGRRRPPSRAWSILVVGRSLALAQISDPLFRDAAAADLGRDARRAASSGRSGSACSRCCSPPRPGSAPPRSTRSRRSPAAREIARTPPSRPGLGRPPRRRRSRRSASGMIVEPLSAALQIVAVVAGAWLVYVAIVELLGILAPVEAGAQRRRARAGSARCASAAAVAVDRRHRRRRPRDRRRAAQRGAAARPARGLQRLPGALRQANRPGHDPGDPQRDVGGVAEPGWFLPNQRYGIIRQLDDGIRGLLIDTHYGIGAGRPRLRRRDHRPRQGEQDAQGGRGRARRRDGAARRGARRPAPRSAPSRRATPSPTSATSSASSGRRSSTSPSARSTTGWRPIRTSSS